ncbi:146R protein [Yaba-like disease virus]|uniref:146R protein n=1 Tax=Yaba-like disease virus TaxID=132475 RepID=Q9DHG7_YLDV|nr:146R protein [Yaba-like disease virus]CAC21384.1 146R protein [Yaba-like disease virus]
MTSIFYKYILLSTKIKYNMVKYFLDKKNNVNEIYRGMSILQQYLKKKTIKINIVKLLIKNGANVNYRGSLETPICSLLNNYKVNCVVVTKVLRLLLKYGADINLPTINGVYPFICLMYNSNINVLPMIKLFLKYGANTEVEDFNGNNLISIYLEKSKCIKTSVLELLINNNISISNIKFTNNNIPIKIIKYLIKKFEVRDNFFQSLFESFLVNVKTYNKKNIHMLDFIINGIKDSIPHPILWTAKFNNQMAFDYCLKLGDDINAVSENGNTCITFALHNGSGRLFSTVLRKNPSPKLIKNTFNYFSVNGLGDIVINKNKSVLMTILIRYAFSVYPIFYKNCNDLVIHFSEIINYCEKELNCMKTEIVDKGLSVYDIIFNKEIESISLKHVTSNGFLKFKNSIIYGKKINEIIIFLVQRYELVNRAIKVIDKKCNGNKYWWYLIPNEIKVTIVNFLSNEELKNIIRFNFFKIMK